MINQITLLVFFISAAGVVVAKGHNEILLAISFLVALFSALLLHRFLYQHICSYIWVFLIFITYKILEGSYYMKDIWISALYLNIGSSIIMAVIIDFLLLSRKGEENERLDRIERKLDKLMGESKD